jgi:pre-rRNA-processing protein TSR1
MLQGQEEKAEERARRVEMQMRGDDELEFEDEVEYAAEELLREKYRHYQGLKSFKSSQWNELENLPEEYDRIFFFKHYAQTQRAAAKDNLARGFAYPGFYVRVTLSGSDVERIAEYSRRMPLLLSFLLKHERKMTVLHGKVQSNPHYAGEAEVLSGQPAMVSVGFRRLLVSPLFSRCVNGTEKTKFTRRVGTESEGQFFCSFYGLNQFPPSPFLVFRVNPLCPDQVEGAPLLRGELAKCDPHHIVLERIILTGYPYKINRRRSTVRFMFFNPADVKFFRPVEVRTKLGLRVFTLLFRDESRSRWARTA